MTFRGYMKDGIVVLDDAVSLPDGAEVSINIRKRRGPSKKRSSVSGRLKAGKRSQTLYDCMKPFVGSLNDFPPDYSINLDHYLYGLPKRKK